MDFSRKKLLKSEIGIEGTDLELEIHKNLEDIVNPKAVIENIISLSKENQVNRKKNKGLIISDLFQIIGHKADDSHLEKLASYMKFKKYLIEKLTELNSYYK